MIPTYLYTDDMPWALAQFRDLVGDSHWIRRVRAIESEIRGQGFLRDLLLEENTIAFALARWFKDMEAGRAQVNDRSLYPMFRFVAQTLSFIEHAPAERKDGFIRRIHGAFRNPDDMRALEAEFAVATHFVRRGRSISWPEMQGTGRFDLLVEGVGPRGLEVEVKSVSSDKGRKIHRRDALVFNEFVHQRLEHAAQRLTSGLSVVLTIPNRLPGTDHEREELAECVRQAVLAGRSMSFANGSDVRLADFEVDRFPRLGPAMTPQLRHDIDCLTGTVNREVMILGRVRGGALVFVVQSREEDSFLRYTFDTIERAAKQQLSATRAGIVLAALRDVSISELVETAQQDRAAGEPPTALRIAVSKFLGGRSIEHVVGVGFLSRHELEINPAGSVATGGSAYHFARNESSFWHPDFGGIFEKR